jgi:hypothetical protein
LLQFQKGYISADANSAIAAPRFSENLNSHPGLCDEPALYGAHLDGCFVPEKLRLDFVSAKCGAGKTSKACEYIRENVHLTNFLYIAPSLDLVNQTAETLRSLRVNPVIITSSARS